jgi:hypothetical protein
MEFVRSYHSIGFGLPRNRVGSAPASTFSRPAQRLLSLRPACSPSRLCDLLHRRLQQLRCLRRCFDCYRVERTSSRAGLTPVVDHRLSRRFQRKERKEYNEVSNPVCAFTMQVDCFQVRSQRAIGDAAVSTFEFHERQEVKRRNRRSASRS